MANIYEGFVQAINEAPHDDAPRLIYADWLEEYGNDPFRAEFIRVQCRLATISQDDPERPDLMQRERTLYRQHRAEWLGKLPVGSGLEYEFIRGFPGMVSMARAQFKRRAKAIFANAPITELEIINPFDRVDQWEEWNEENELSVEHIVRFPGLQRLSRLRIDGYMNSVDAVVKHSQNFTALRILELVDSYIEEQVLQTFERVSFPSLTTLNLQDNSFGTTTVQGFQALRILMRQSVFPLLRTINLQNNDIGAEYATALLDLVQHSPLSIDVSKNRSLGSYYISRLLDPQHPARTRKDRENEDQDKQDHQLRRLRKEDSEREWHNYLQED